MQKPATALTSNPALGFVEFDDRGNSRWIPHAEVRTEETLIRMLEVDWLALVPDEKPTGFHVGHAGSRRPQRRRTSR